MGPARQQTGSAITLRSSDEPGDGRAGEEILYRTASFPDSMGNVCRCAEPSCMRNPMCVYTKTHIMRRANARDCMHAKQETNLAPWRITTDPFMFHSLLLFLHSALTQQQGITLVVLI